MLIFAYALLLIPAAIAIPTFKRQNGTDTISETNTTARASIGGADNPITVVGTVDAQLGLDKYLNIPFAKPRKTPHSSGRNIRTDSLAVGDLRFALPKPAEYSGTINATVNGPACLQATPDYASAFGDLVGPYGTSEDCLQLNVLVPRDVITIGTGMPVMVFVHGGGFFGGSANSVDGSLLVSTAAKMVCYLSARFKLTDRASHSFSSRFSTESGSWASRKTA